MKLVGKINYIGILEILEEIYTEDYIEFYDKNNNKLTDEYLSEFFDWLNEPWGQMDETYNIHINAKDNYSPLIDELLPWVCEYKIIGYERVMTIIYGYGNSPESALGDCINLFNVYKKYEIENLED